jgi:hypothetical protein
MEVIESAPPATPTDIVQSQLHKEAANDIGSFSKATKCETACPSLPDLQIDDFRNFGNKNLNSLSKPIPEQETRSSTNKKMK